MSASVTVYLIHLEPAFKHAQHYIGVTRREEVETRVQEHRDGRGAVMLRYAAAAGCEIKLVRTWENVPWRTEAKLKGRSAKPLCPLCAPSLPKRLRKRS